MKVYLNLRGVWNWKGALFFKGVYSIKGPFFVCFWRFALLFECLYYFLRSICLWRELGINWKFGILMVYLWKEYFSKGFFIFWVYILSIVIYFIFSNICPLDCDFFFFFQCSSLWLWTIFSTFQCLSLLWSTLIF